MRMRNIPGMQLFNMFKPRRKKRGAVWASLVGLGITAAVMGLSKGRGKNFSQPFTNAVKTMAPKVNHGMNNAVKNMAPKINVERMGKAALAEFSDELLESTLNNKRQ